MGSEMCIRDSFWAASPERIVGLPSVLPARKMNRIFGRGGKKEEKPKASLGDALKKGEGRVDHLEAKVCCCSCTLIFQATLFLYTCLRVLC